LTRLSPAPPPFHPRPLRRQPERRPWSAAEGPSEGEPQQAAPSSFVWPGAPADGKIKDEGRGWWAGADRMGSEGMAA